MYDNFKFLYKQYGEYVIAKRMLPSNIDGLRLSERRVLYATYLEAKDKLRKSIYIVGKANILHPHGESSLYGTLSKLVNFNLIDGQGNWGSRVGINDDPPAAARYTEVKLNKDIYNLAFELLKFAEFGNIELEEEPLYLPTMIPIGLLFLDVNSTPAFGIKTTIPTYRIKDLISRLLFLLGYNKKESIIKPYYGEEIEILSEEEKCKQLLETGQSSITFCPKLYINKYERKIEIKSRPVGKKFNSLLNALDKKIKEGVIYIIDKSTTTTNIEIGVVKNRKYDFNNLVKLVKQKVSSTITYSCYFVNQDNNAELISVDQLLLNCYNYYLKCNKRQLDNSILELENKIKELEVILKIRPHINYVIKNNIARKEIVPYLPSKTNIKEVLIKKVINKYNIERLLYIKFDLDELNNQLEKYRNLDINKQVINKYKKLIRS